MCSIVGGAGDVASLTARQQHEVHEFLSCLFMCGELRGRDASGFWVWRDKHYVFEKRPIPAQELVYRSMGWKSLRYNPGTLYIMHARATTDGDPNKNINNHPHIGEHSVLIHNGMIWNHENIAKAHDIKLSSDCDSEILLRLAEQKKDLAEGVEHMAKVIKQAPSNGSWAIATIDRRNPTEIILARNISPLVLYRCKRLNMSFFASTEEIFERACNLLYKQKNTAKLGFEKMPTDIHKIYRLKNDGTIVVEKPMKIEETTYHNNNTHYAGDTTTSFRKQPKHPYIFSDVFGFEIEISPLGKITEFADTTDEAQAEPVKEEEIVIAHSDEAVLASEEKPIVKEELEELIQFIRAI